MLTLETGLNYDKPVLLRMRREIMLVLEGVRILDLTWQGPGPFCTMILGDLGAEIIRVGAPPAAGAPRSLREFQEIPEGGS